MDALNIPANFEVRSLTQSWYYRGYCHWAPDCL